MLRSVAAALVLTVALAAPAAAQRVARAQDGKPDLTGHWTNASVTQLARTAGARSLVVDEAEAARLAGANFMVRQMAAEQRPSDPTDNLLADRNTALGYNITGWMDPGTTLAKVRGEYRTSWLVDPDTGQLPLTDAGRAAQRAAAVRAPMIPDHPEQLAPNDRCLIGSRGSGGPGMLNNIYNSNYQIVQTPGAVAIVVEMVHDVRTIPIFATAAAARAAHRPAAIRQWLGDSVGWWEGDVLVVETLNVHPDQGGYGPIFLSERGRVLERFSRVAADEIFYAFEVEDPVYYTRPWKAEMSLRPAPGRVYEYACHEGNYGMFGILHGARQDEARRAGR